MMLVVAVALSTATYAWFTTNNKVEAQPVILTAATASAPAILITHNANGSAASNAISLTAQGNSKLYPATPLNANAFTVFYGSEASQEQIAANSINNIDINFKNLLMDGSGNYVNVTKNPGDVSFYKDTFYVFNKGASAVTLVPTVTIRYNDSVNTSKMAAMSARVAIVERVGTQAAMSPATAVTFAADGYSLKGIWEFNSSAALAADYSYIEAAAYDEGATYFASPTATEATEVANATAFANLTDPVYVRTQSVFRQITSYNNTVGFVYYERQTNGAFKVVTIADENAFNQAGTLYEKIDTDPAIANKNTATEITYNSDKFGVADGTVTDTFVKGTVAFSSADFTEIGTATSGNHIANEYTVVVWLEGWDIDCTNAITAGVFTVDVSFTTAA